ncbi:MAG: ribonuclease P protein component [Betaproteobacteria bacterium]|nr:ribonuclease P protein component [Betaproteobacteria bacterium]
MPLAFGRHMKMRKTDEFSSVFRFKCTGGNAGLAVMAAPNGLEHARLGLIIPKRIIADAVRRNRVKRLLREGFRLRQHELHGLDIVARMKAEMTETDLLDTFGSAMLLCESCVRKRLRNAAAALPA